MTFVGILLGNRQVISRHEILDWGIFAFRIERRIARAGLTQWPYLLYSRGTGRIWLGCGSHYESERSRIPH
jgi:hypothetical protein